MPEIPRDTISEILAHIAQMLELKSENPFKIRAYTNAARAIELYSGDLKSVAEAGKLDAIDGIGKALAEKLSELLTTGRMTYYETLKDEFVPEIFQLFEIPGLGAKKIRVLHDTLGINSVSRLERACKTGKIAELEGFGEKTQKKLLEAIEHRRKNQDRYCLGTAAPWAEALVEHLRDLPETTRVQACGSYRRRKEIVGDLDFVVSTRKPAAVADAFVAHPLVEKVIARGDTKTSVILKPGIQADLRLVSDAEFPFAVQYFTGSKEHNVAIRGRAREKGWTLNEYRLAPEKEGAPTPPVIHDEAGIYRALDLEYIEPELRENSGEIAAAEAGTLPRLIEWENLRGVFHNHTTTSDGRHTLEEMVDAARELGFAYYGVADHSKSSFQANGLSAERLMEQVKSIRELDAKLDDIELLAGVECDILKDGSLDYPDEILAKLDYVVASVHSVFSLSEADMTARIIKAMENPHVTMLGHLTGRLLLIRESYALDIPAILDAAARTGTWIELNANPRRLELDWRWWRAAKERGVKCVINPDAHSTEGLQDVWYGVCAARKGWLTKQDVVNCLPWKEIQQLLKLPAY